MNLIVAVDRNWAIGKNGKLLASIPEDMQFFRQTTTGHIVVMGRRTLESFPGKQALPQRMNIVLSRNPSFQAKNVTVFASPESLRKELAKYPSEEVFIIGGESIYREFLPDCDTAYVTKIDYAYDADTWFPNLDEREDWRLAEQSEEKTSFDLAYHFTVYRREQ